MRLVIFSFTDKGSALSALLKQHLFAEGYECEGYAVERFARKYGLRPCPGDWKAYLGEIWGECAVLFVGAAGIAVRMIAPYVRDKFADSAVVVMDEKGQFAIPILSGHVGGAVELARSAAKCTGGTAVITTATDVQERFAVDVFAKKNELFLTDRECAKRISAALLEGKEIGIFVRPASKASDAREISGNLPEGLRLCRSVEELEKYEYGIFITDSSREAEDVKSSSPKQILTLLPRNVVIGIGCRRGLDASRIREGVCRTLGELGICREQVAAIVSIDLKKEEQGILRTAEEYQVPFLTFTAEELRTTGEVSAGSSFVEKVTGVDNVCERAVKYACKEGGDILLAKTCLDGMTIAVGRKKQELHFSYE